MKKKYLYGIIAGIMAILVATFLFVWLGAKCALRVSANEGYTVTVKDIELDEKGTANVRKGEDLVFAVVLDPNYSDSNVKVMANDTEITGKQGVYRYTVEEDTTITIDGVTENDYITQGVDVDPGTLDGEGYILLRDENKRPVPVLADIGINSVDRLDIPNLDLTASVLESVNPGWSFRELNAINLGKYAAAKFYVKHSNYLEAKFSFGEKFYEQGGNDKWHEFWFKNDEGMMTLYVDGEKIGSCNYLSDVQFCLQDKGSYKFSHIYVIPKDDYQGGMLSVEEGEGYQVDIPAREYALGATLQFHVDINEGFMKGSNFAVKAGSQVLEAREDGSYTFVFNSNTTIRVSGVVPKPLDSRYQVVGIPMRAEMEETTNYILVQSVADSKTYTHTQPSWGSLGFEDLELKQYSNLLFFIKKEGENPNQWMEILQTADDGTVTPYMQKNDNIWHKVEIKKEGGQMYLYLDGERNNTPIIDTEHLSFVLNDGVELRITSLLGIVDPNYIPPEPDYISNAYKVIGTPIALEGEEVENYILVSKAEDAKTYEHTPDGWRGFNMVEMDYAPYKSLLFFVHKEDVNTNTYLEVLKGDVNQIPHEADYVATNENKWHKIELVKNAQGTLDVYVNGVKHDVPVAETKDIMITISANATLTYTSLFGISDPAYVPPEPDYIDSEYETIASSLMIDGEEIENYVLVSKTEDAKTYKYNPPGWRTFGMADVDVAPYKSFIFFVHKEDVNSSTWLELYKGEQYGTHLADYISTNDNKWYKVELVKNAQGTMDVYVNDEKKDGTIASTEELTFTLSANATLMYTSVFGIADPNYVPPQPDYIDSQYQTIQEAFDLQGQEIANYELVSQTADAKTYQYQPQNWNGFGLKELEEARYQSLILFVHKDDVSNSTWLELYKGVVNGTHDADYISTNNNDWYKVELVKTSANEWDVYVNDVKHDTTIASVTDLTFTISGGATLMYTSVFGITDPNYVEPQPTVEDVMVVTSPWAYYRASMDNSNTYAEKGYEYATKIPGYYLAYDLHATMKDVDMSLYSEFRFAIKSSGGSYSKYEVKLAGDNTTFENDALFTGENESGWTEYVFKCEDDGTGTEKFHMYKAGEATDVWLPANMNLSDLQMRGSYDEGAVMYMTEVRGVVRESAESELKVVAPSFNTLQGDTVDTEKPIRFATSSTKVETSWSGTKSPLADVALSGYSKLIFYARQYEGSGYFESDFLGTDQFGDVWVEFKLVKNANKTWNLYCGGVLKSANVSLTNLNQVNATYGNGKYYFSQVFGVEEETQEPTPGTPVETMIVTTPWSYHDSVHHNPQKFSVLDKTQAYTAGGYEYANIVPGGQVYYTAPLMQDMDMSVYSEFRFAVKTNGSYWYEAGLAANNDFGAIVGAETEWTEYVFKYEEEGTNVGYHLYKGGNATSTWFPADLNLSDIRMKFSADTNGRLYITEVRGTLKEGATNSLQVVLDNFHGLGEDLDSTATKVETEKPNGIATGSTQAKTAWRGDAHNNMKYFSLANVSLASYEKILFYVRKPAEDGAWLQSSLLGDFVVGTTWTEFRLEKNANGNWDIYVSGVLYKSNQALSKLSDITVALGTSNYYFSEVFGVPTEDNRPVLVGEHVVVTTPWSYHDSVHHNPQKFSVLDKSEAYTAGGYEYANIVPGGEVYYDAPLMQDMDMSVYSEFRFAVKTNGSYWYEGGLAANNDFGAIVGAETEWTEYVFKYEENGTNTGYRLYKGGNVTNTWFPADLNLSDIRMKFSADTNGRLYITEVRGTLKEGQKTSLWTLSDNFHGLGEDLNGATTKVDAEKPNGIATGSTQAPVAWRGDANNNMKYFPLANVSLASYKKILFYVRKPAEDGAWFQSGLLGDFVVGTTWTEFRLEKKGNGNWDIYVSGILYKSNQALSKLSDITAAFGTSTYYFSEVYGVK